MASIPDTNSPEPDALAWPAGLLGGWLQMQQLQLQTALAWQRSAAEWQQEFLDRWLCQFAGGARIGE